MKERIRGRELPVIYPRTEYIDAHLLRGWPKRGYTNKAHIHIHPKLHLWCWAIHFRGGPQAQTVVAAHSCFSFGGVIMFTKASQQHTPPPLPLHHVRGLHGVVSRSRIGLSCYGRCDNWFGYSLLADRIGWLLILRHITTDGTQEYLSKVHYFLAYLPCPLVSGGGGFGAAGYNRHYLVPGKELPEDPAGGVIEVPLKHPFNARHYHDSPARGYRAMSKLLPQHR